MMNYENLKESGLDHLENKQVRVSDVIRLINNKSIKNNVPNFSLLLGAGASVTSGIRSGQDLILSWKNEISQMMGITEQKEIEEYFSSQTIRSWYDSNNEYGSLFERMYSLQKQRRLFVENEVQGGIPSIGYAYLVNLMSNNIFNTVFTTNFDDLISEAFYSFSNERPIVCAHDSSISSISVTSTRPKIVKLHGDYLFDNIKATVRETESLEHNMRMKFQEFAKDYGLIVIGYSGNDRSIMDIFSYLLSKDEYFKNGIYWCIRKGDNPCSELISLLSKDRVYFVEIDGFDEFMAELNNKLNGGRLPINEGFLSYQHQDALIKTLIENQYVQKSSSLILKGDCENLKKQLKDNKMNDFLKFVREQKDQEQSNKKYSRYTERKTPFGEMSQVQKSVIDKINFEAFALGNTNKAIQLISEEDVFSLEPSSYKIELLELYADIHPLRSDVDVKHCFDALIEIDPNNHKHYIVAANRSNSFNQKYNYLLSAEKVFHNSVRIKNHISSALLSFCESFLVRDKKEEYLKKAFEVISESLSLNKSISNEAYVQKARYFLLKYDNDRPQLKTESEFLINECRSLSLYHNTTLEVMKVLKSRDYTEDLLNSALVFHQSSARIEDIEDVSLRLIDYYAEDACVEKALSITQNFEKEYEPSRYYYLSKAKLLGSFEFFNSALEVYNQLDSSEGVVIQKLRIYHFLEDDNALKALYSEWIDKNNYEVDSTYYGLMGDYSKVVEVLKNKQLEIGLLSTSDLIEYSYALLHIEDYQSCVDLLKTYYSSPVILSQELYINYLFAAYHLDSKNVDKIDKNSLQTKINDRIIKSPERGDTLLVAAYALLGDQVRFYESLARVVQKYPILKYTIKDWPIVQRYSSQSKFKELVKATPHSC